jgi:hypothetical protein
VRKNNPALYRKIILMAQALKKLNLQANEVKSLLQEIED